MWYVFYYKLLYNYNNIYILNSYVLWSFILILALYYRIKLIDANGAFKYSNTITITLPSFAGAVSISPNPAISQMRASVLSPADCKADWSVIDNTGRIILKGNTLIKKGNNQLIVNVNNLAAGAYYLHIAGSNIDCKTRFQKL